MKPIFTFLLLSIGLSLFAQQDLENLTPQELLDFSTKSEPLKVQLRTEDFLLDSTYRYYFDTTLQDYFYVLKNLYTYNTAGFITSETTNSFIELTGTYQDYYREEYTYDSENNLVEKSQQRYDFITEQWQYDVREIYTYENSTTTIIVEQTWEEASNGWENWYRSTYVKDAAENIVKVTLEKWDDVNPDDWVFLWTIDYEYNAQNLPIDGFFRRWNSTLNDWEEESRSTFIYDAAGNNVENLFRVWNSNMNDWDNSSRRIMTYDLSNNLLELISQIWTGTAWMNNRKEINSYDAAQNHVEVIAQTYFQQEWENNWKENYTYDTDNNQIQKLGFCWQCRPPYEEIWSPGEREDYFWSSFSTAVSKTQIPTLDCQYSNPFILGEQIKCELAEEEEYQILIYDVQGKILRREVIADSFTWSGQPNLGTGIYFMLIENEGRVVYRDKLVVVGR